MDNKPLTRTEAADYLGVNEQTLAMMAMRGTGPRYSKLSGRLVRYRVSDLDAWVEAHMMSDTKTPVKPARRARVAS